MTIEELNQLAYLEKAIKLEQDRLETLRENAGVKSPVISDMPKAPGARDKLGEIVPNIVDQKSWQEVADYIDNGEGKDTDYTVRQACYRYVEGKAYQIPGQISMF